MSYAYAGTYGPEQIIDLAGAPQPNITVTVYKTGTLVLATLYTDHTKAHAGVNPLLTSPTGNLTFFADPGIYDVSFPGGGLLTVQLGIDPLEPVTGDMTGTPPGPLSLAASSAVEAIITANATVAGAEQTSHRGAPSGYATLDGSSHVPQAQLANGVQSFNTRTGAVVPASADYTAAQVTNAADKAAAGAQVFTGQVTAPEVAANASGTVGRYVGVLSAAPGSGTWNTGDYGVGVNGVWACSAGGTPGTWINVPAVLVASFNTRTGAVVPASGDYTAAQVTNAADKSSGSSQAFTGIVSAPELSANGVGTAGRFIGTSNTVPVSGTWNTGDFCIGTAGVIICTTGGTPGVWITIGASGGGGSDLLVGPAIQPLGLRATVPMPAAKMGVGKAFSGSNANAGICVGPDGNLWTADFLAGFYKFNPITGAKTHYTTAAGVGQICAGPDGNLWSVLSNLTDLYKCTPAGTITNVATIAAGATLAGICAGPDGNLWVADQGAGAHNKVYSVTTAGVVSSGYALGGTSYAGQGNPMIAGPDGNIWFANANNVSKITPAGVVTNFTTTLASPIGMCVGIDGNIWIANASSTTIARVTPAGVVTNFTVGTISAGIFGICSGPDGNLYVTDSTSTGKIAQVSTQGVTLATITTAVTRPREACIGPDGALWYYDQNNSQVGVTPLAKTQRAKASCPIFQAPTSPPVSTTAYQNTFGMDIDCLLTYTPAAAAGDVLVQLSPDNSSYTTYADPGFLANAAVGVLRFPVPAGWYYKVTLTGAGAALTSLVALG